MPKVKILRTGNFIRHVVGCYRNTDAANYLPLATALTGYALTEMSFFVRRRKVVDFNIKGLDVSVNCFSGEITGFWENFLDDKYGSEKIQRDRICIMDVGGNAGFFSMNQIVRYGDKLRLFAFEPDPDVYSRLSANVQRANRGKNAEVNAVNSACGSTQGKTRFFRRRSCLSRVAKEGDDASRCVDISIDTLDNVVRSNRVDHIDLLKIDTEGFELEVLKGATTAALPITQRVVMQYHNNNEQALGDFLTGLGFQHVWTNEKKETAMFERPSVGGRNGSPATAK